MNNPNAPTPRDSMLDVTIDRSDRIKDEVREACDALGHEYLASIFGEDAEHDAQGNRISCMAKVDVSLVLRLHENDTLQATREKLVDALRELADKLDSERSRRVAAVLVAQTHRTFAAVLR